MKKFELRKWRAEDVEDVAHYANNKHINVPIIYGDYFFTEALIKLKHPTSIF